MKFFTSDSHYAHSNICKAISKWKSQSADSTRDHASLEEMNSKIVEAINKVVSANDELWHLGDWSFGGIEQVKIFRDRLKCNRIHLILGNHDKHLFDPNVRSLFESVSLYKELSISPKSRAMLFHYPIQYWHKSHHGSIHLHGHIHSTCEHKISKMNRLDVGIDGTDPNHRYEPYNLDQIDELLKAYYELHKANSFSELNHHSGIEDVAS